jgi:hypothetical protein
MNTLFKIKLIRYCAINEDYIIVDVIKICNIKLPAWHTFIYIYVSKLESFEMCL